MAHGIYIAHHGLAFRSLPLTRAPYLLYDAPSTSTKRYVNSSAVGAHARKYKNPKPPEFPTSAKTKAKINNVALSRMFSRLPFSNHNAIESSTSSRSANAETASMTDASNLDVGG